MYMCYVDESGHNGKKYNPDQPVQVLCGVLIDITKINKTQKELDLILRFLNKKGIPITELKASDAYRGRKHWGNVKPQIRDKIFRIVLDWAKSRSCKFIVSPIDTKLFFDLKASQCTISSLLQYPYEAGALNILLAIQKINFNKPRNKGKTIVVFDEQHGHDENLIKILEGDLSFTDPYTGHNSNSKKLEPRLNQIIDIPHFSKSHLSVLIQVADWAAFIIAQYLLLTSYGHLEKYSGELEKIKTWYDAIGECLVSHTSIDPPIKAPICEYYRSIRPSGWSPKKWTI